MKPIDLPRVQRARAALAQLVEQHPRLRQGTGRWSDNPDELERAITMGTPAPERVRQYRARLRAAGRTRISVFLTPEAHAALLALREQHPNLATNDIMSDLLTGRIQITEEPRP